MHSFSGCCNRFVAVAFNSFLRLLFFNSLLSDSGHVFLFSCLLRFLGVEVRERWSVCEVLCACVKD